MTQLAKHLENEIHSEVDKIKNLDVSLYVQKLYAEGSISETWTNEEELMKSIREAVSFVQKNARILANCRMPLSLSYIPESKEGLVRVELMNVSVSLSRVNLRPISLNPDSITVGCLESEEEAIPAFLHEIGHFLTPDFTIKPLKANDSLTLFVDMMTSEIVAWKIALKLNRLLGLTDYGKGFHTWMFKGMMSHLLGEIDRYLETEALMDIGLLIRGENTRGLVETSEIRSALVNLFYSLYYALIEETS